MRVLLVEDDRALAEGIRAALAQSGYSVDVAALASEARLRARTAAYVLGILDLGLPDADGLDLLRELRADGHAFPVLILSARGALTDRINGLDGGADDYLPKPFALAELEARLRALLRRREDHRPWRQLGRLRFDTRQQQVLVGDENLNLTAREFAVLSRLMARVGRVISKQALFEAVFEHDTNAAPNALEVHISRLRQKLRGAGVQIRALRGLGYRIQEGSDNDTADG